MGSLEEAVMSYLWEVDEPATPAQVHSAIGDGLAYTTVMTILTRLWKKGRLTRERSGRAFAYMPVRSEADHKADGMHELLSKAADGEAVLSRFVDELAAGDAETLRRLLDGDT